MQKEVFSKLPKSVVFAADVGGTNTSIALCSVIGKNVKLHVKYSFVSQDLKKFEDVVKFVLEDSGVKISVACIAAAGPVSVDRKSVKLTNLSWKIETKKLPFKSFLLNDFEAVGFAVNVLKPKDVSVIRKGKQSNSLIGLIGAGTGLGKSLLYNFQGVFYPTPSEGGHCDLPFSRDEFPLMNWLSRNNSLIEYEDVLSGRGVVAVHNFFLTRLKGERTSDPAVVMSSNSPAAKAARKQFVKFYARCAKNFALEGLTRDGIYIGGGIAAKNPKLFSKEFIAEFMNSKSQKAVLKDIPIKVITNYNAGLFGAAFASQCPLWFRG